jgi:hypothetical protein
MKKTLKPITKISVPIFATATAAMLLAISPLAAWAGGGFTPGNLVVERLGDGTQTLATTGNTMFMDEFTPGGTAVQSVQIDNSDSSALIDDGTASTSGAMTLSPNGQLLCFPGYNTTQPYTASLSVSQGTVVPRGVGILNANGIYQLVATTLTNYSGTTIRGATTDGNGNFWTSGGSLSGVGGGICYLGTNSPATLLTDGTFRQAYLFGTNLWFDVQNSSGAGGYNLGLYEFSGAPTNGPASATQVFTLAGSSTYGMSLDNPANPMVIYFADATLSGIHKWTNNGSGTWTQAYLVYSAANLFGLAVDWSTKPATIYATTTGAGNKLIKVVDNGPGSAATVLATASSKQIFRGVAFAPISVTAGNNNSGNNLNLTCSMVPGGAYSWTGPNGFSSSLQNPTVANASPAAAGTYTVTATWDGSLYNATARTTATIFPSATITAASSVCPGSTGNTASVPDASAGASYLWTIGGGTITAGTGTAAITYTANTSGSITLGCAVTNSLGNGAKGSATVSILATPAARFNWPPPAARATLTVGPAPMDSFPACKIRALQTPRRSTAVSIPSPARLAAARLRAPPPRSRSTPFPIPRSRRQVRSAAIPPATWPMCPMRVRAQAMAGRSAAARLPLAPPPIPFFSRPMPAA